MDAPKFIVLGLGDSLFALSSDRAVAAAGLHPTTRSSRSWCTDVDVETTGIRDSGAPVLVEPYDHLAVHRRACVADPDGNWLALVDAH